MNSTASTIARNAAALIGTQVITWLLALLLTVFLPRYLGPDGLGELQIANSIWAIAGVLAAWGMDTYLTKEIARRPEQTGGLLRKSFILRTLLFVVASVPVALYVMLHTYEDRVLDLIIIIGLSQLLTQYAAALLAALQGLELMDRSSVATVISKIFYTLGGIGVLVLGYGLYGFAWIITITSLVTVLGYLFFLRQHLRSRSVSAEAKSMALLRDSTPYLVSALILVAYGQIDALIIGSLINTTVVGWYSVALQLYGTFLFLPVLLSSAMFPAITRSFAEGSSTLQPLVRKSFDVVMLVAVPIGMGLIVVSDSLVLLLFGQAFAPSGPILALMGLVTIVMYPNILLGRFMIAIDRQNVWTSLMVVATIITIGADILLVPWFHQSFGNGALGAGVSFMITELGMLIAGLFLLPRGMLGRQNAITTARILVAGLLMVAACWWSRHMFIGIPIVIGAVTYSAMIILLRAVSPEDLELGRTMVKRGLERFVLRPMQVASVSKPQSDNVSD